MKPFHGNICSSVTTARSYVLLRHERSRRTLASLASLGSNNIHHMPNPRRRLSCRYNSISDQSIQRRIFKPWAEAFPKSVLRCLASSTSLDMKSVTLQKSKRILETPPGKFDDSLWTEAHATILWWLNTCLEENISSITNEEAKESIHRALGILDRLYDEEQELLQTHDADIPEFFNEELLNLILNRWRLLIGSRRLQPGAPGMDTEEVDEFEEKEAIPSFRITPNDILEKLYRYQETSPNLQPNVQSYSMVIDTIASMVEIYNEDYKLNEKQDLMEMVDQIMDWLVEQACGDHDSTNAIDDISSNPNETSAQIAQPPTPHHAPVPNVVLFSSAMNAWTKSGLRNAPDRVEELLQTMLTLKEWYPEWDIAPNKFTYSTAIDAWAKVKKVGKVKELLQTMHQRAIEENDPSLKPGLPAFNGYLVALAKSGRVEEAEALLGQMEDLYDSGELEDPPSVISYTTVIDGFARSSKDGASIRAEAFMRRMMEREETSPNAVTYNSVINAHVQSFNIEAAEKLLREMHETYLRSGNMEIRPTMQSYSVVISGFAKSRRKDAGERAERILEQIKEMARSGDLDEPPDVILYNSVLDCWAKSSATPETAERAVTFLEKMKEDRIIPDVISYNTAIHCLARSGRAQEAELMLDAMTEERVSPNAITYNTLLAAHLNQITPHPMQSKKVDTTRAKALFEKMRGDTNIEPDVVTYNTMLHAYSREGAVEKAENLLQEMLNEESPVSPDSTSINTVINAWTKTGRHDAPQRAEAILDRMLQPNASSEESRGIPSTIRPTSITFNSVMTAWNRTRRPEAAERCQNLYDLMKNNEVAPIEPDFITFNIMIHAWSLSFQDDAPDKAEALLLEMHERFKAGNARMRPNTKTYGSLINVWAKSRRSEAGQKADEYLRKIIQLSEGKQNSHSSKSRSFRDEQPRVFEFTSTIRAWYKSQDPMAPFKADTVLYLLMEQVKRGNKEAIPDSKFFGAFLQTLASSTVPNKKIYADRVVELMIEFKIKPNKMLLDLLNKCYSNLHEKSRPLDS